MRKVLLILAILLPTLSIGQTQRWLGYPSEKIMTRNLHLGEDSLSWGNIRIVNDSLQYKTSNSTWVNVGQGGGGTGDVSFSDTLDVIATKSDINASGLQFSDTIDVLATKSDITASGVQFSDTLDVIATKSDIPTGVLIYSDTSTLISTISYVDTSKDNIRSSMLKWSDTLTRIATKAEQAGNIKQGGNSFGAVMSIGSNDNNPVRIRANNTERAAFGTSGQLVVTGNIATNGNVTDAAPPYSVTIPSSGNGIAVYNTTDQTTNYERVRMGWSGNTFNILTEAAGTGTARTIQLLSNSGGVAVSGSGFVTLFRNLSNPATGIVSTGTYTNSSGTVNTHLYAPTVNQSGTASYRALWVSPYEQATGSGSKLLLDLGTNTAANGSGVHTSKFNVSNTGLIVAKGIPEEDSLNYRQLVWDLSDSTIKSVARGITFADTNTILATKSDLTSGGMQYSDTTNLIATKSDIQEAVYFSDTLDYIATKADLAGAGGAQSLSSSKSGNTVTLGITGGTGTVFSVADADSSITNEIQTVSKSGNIVTLSNSGGAFSVADSDSSATNEIQNLSIGTRTSTTVPINISSGTGASFPIATTSLAGAMSAADKAKLDSLSTTSSGGTVTSFSSGNLSPLFTTSVATSTTTPALSFSLSNAGANTWFGNSTGSSAAPSYNSLAALTKTDDANVTLTLGGTPATALAKAVSLTLGWTGQLSVARGGTGASTLTGYVKGNGTSAFTASSTIPYTDISGTPTIGNGTLTLATSGIATGSTSFTANQTGNTTFTVNVPATNVGGIGTEWGRVTSSTGSNGYIYGIRSVGGGAIDGNAVNGTENGLTIFSNNSSATNLPVSGSSGSVFYMQNVIAGSAQGAYKIFASSNYDNELWFRRSATSSTWNSWQRFASKEWVGEQKYTTMDSTMVITFTTNNNTTQTAATIPVPSGEVWDVQIRAVGSYSGAEAAKFLKTCMVGNNSGTVALLGSGVAEIVPATQTSGMEDTDVSIGVSTSSVELKVKGVSGQTVKWKIYVTIVKP